jgi:hypothetical protein
LSNLFYNPSTPTGHEITKNMTPAQFIALWKSSTLKERSGAQTHFNQLCDLLGIPQPVVADPLGEWFTFEKGAKKTGGGDGWADVWKKDCFAWEYKGKHKAKYRTKFSKPTGNPGIFRRG